MTQRTHLRFGLIINPYAGIGGAVALKGSDGENIVNQALALGAEKKAAKRVEQCLAPLLAHQSSISFITCAADMGENSLKALGFEYELIDIPNFNPAHTSSKDSQAACQQMLNQNLDLLLFAGGDGTARDVCAVIHSDLPVLGIPCGVKIHSSVYAISPKGATDVLEAFIEGKLVNMGLGEVRDLDEQAYRQEQVRVKHFGEMRVPQLGYFVQATKQGGVESSELVLEDLQAHIERFIEEQQDIEPDTLFLIGAGKTTHYIFSQLGFDTSLLGVDALVGDRIIQKDLTAKQMGVLLDQYTHVRVFISVIGGQGHIIGRGNQQFSADNLKRIGKENLVILASKGKIRSLEGRPLIIDSSDALLDASWAGSIEVITGYQDCILYPLA